MEAALSHLRKIRDPIKEEPIKEEPIKEEPIKEEPIKEEPIKEEPIKAEDLARLSPLGHEHINFLGRYSFAVAEPVVRGELRPLILPEAIPETDAKP